MSIYNFTLSALFKYQRKLNRLTRLFTNIKCRNLSTMIDENYTKEPKELEIKTPYGHIAGKLWNSEGKSLPILALHGWLDNAGTWDVAAPLIDPSHPLLSIDFPGHGLSSYIPAGTGGYLPDMLVAMERVIKHFKWTKFILLGHSMGGAVAMIYAGTFPERVKKLIMVDILRPISVAPEDQPSRTAKFLTEIFSAEKKLLTAPPKYGYDELVKKLVKSYFGSLTEESAKVLLKRGAKKLPDGKYSLRYSPMLRITNGLSMTYEQQKGFAENVSCEVVIIKADYMSPMFGDKEQNHGMIETLRKSTKSLQFHMAPGNHHFHIDHPGPVVQIINNFLQDIPQTEESRKDAESFFAKHF